MLPPRFRKSDLFAVLGILALLTWAPAYVAQDPAMRDETTAQTLHLPPPRIGDEAVLEMVIHRAGRATMTIPDVETVRHAAPDHEDCPVGTVMQRERYLRPLNVTFGWGAIERDEMRYWLCFDAEGRAVWGGVEVVRGAIGAHATRVEGVPSWRVVENDFLMVAGRTEIRQNPAPLASLAHDGVQDLLGWPGRDRIQMTALDVLHHRERQYLGGQMYYSPDMPWDWWDDDPGEQRYGPSVDRSSFDFYYEDIGLVIDVREEVVVQNHLEYRRLIDPEWPTPVGGHYAWGPEAGPPDLAITLAPAMIHRGEGVEVLVDVAPPVPYDDDWARAERTAAGPLHPIQPAVSIRQTALASLSTVADPLIRGTSLAELDAKVRTEGDATTRQFVEGGGRLIGFAWTAQPPKTFLVTPQEIPTPIQLPNMEDAKTDVLLRTNWLLVYTDEEQRPLFVLVDVKETSQEKTYELFRDCHGGYPMDLWRGFYRCGELLEKESIDPARSLAHPADLVKRAKEDPHRQVSPETELGNFVYIPAVPNATYQDFVVWHGETGRHGATAQVRNGAVNGGISYQTAQAPAGFAAWSEYHQETSERRSGGYTIDSGAALSRLTVSEVETSALVPATAERPAAGSPPTLLELTPATAATVGILLILVSLLVRLASSIKAGAHVAILAPLFSRISKDRALLHERRADIVALVEQEPGLTAKEIAERLGFAWGVTAHHLEKLVANGLLDHTQNGQMRHYFAPGLSGRQRLGVALARDPKYQAFLDAVASSPGVSLRDLVDILPQGKSGASRTGSRLERLGLIEKRRDGRDVRFYPL